MATTKVRAVGRENTDPTERLLNVNDAAAMLAVKPATLYQWAYQRRIPVVKLFGPPWCSPIPRGGHPSADHQVGASSAAPCRRAGGGFTPLTHALDTRRGNHEARAEGEGHEPS